MPDRDVPRVLVVDDDARVRHFLTTALGAAGFAVTATGTGEEGLRLAAARPDLVVLDVDLPDLSGREVCRRLKVAEETAIIPVLMLSGVFTDVADRSPAPGAWPSPCSRPASRCRSSASAPCAGCRRPSRSGCGRSPGATARRRWPSTSVARSGRRTSCATPPSS